MWSSSLFQAMTMAPEPLEVSAATLPLPLAVSTGVRTNVATTEPITKKMPMEVANKIHFFFIEKLRSGYPPPFMGREEERHAKRAFLPFLYTCARICS